MRNQLLGDGQFLLRFWGREEEQVAALCPLPTAFEKPGGARYARFTDAASRQSFLDQVRAQKDWIIALDIRDGPQTLLRTIAVCKLNYQGVERTIEVDFGYGYEDHSAIFMMTDGSYSCDCNRSLYIREKEPDFPELECGEEIVMSEINVIHRQ